MSAHLPIQIEYTHIPDTWRSWAPDLRRRLLPFLLAIALVWGVWRPSWLGLSFGNWRAQLIFAVLGAPALFVAAMFVKLGLARRRRFISVPGDARDAWFQTFFFTLNGPLEEGIFRGILQGFFSTIWLPLGLVAGTVPYVLYHHIEWPWRETLATALIGVPVALAFWLLPGPPSLLGVSIVHIAATCGFLGPGPYLLKKFGFVP
jgi:membrane protease YdiL (CAAX protease family)